ncbi:HepT-like ribonuclease domain-containing protein [Luteibaculum oceani]|uniref:DUF86 domain-containing protein n=1 Tax=Luteibaculum oceani TaxID=1294296 RepID=A0A5C6V148_9FLAO|nr:DUF86 domain-containing protein [Luteibaculum oceani]TXC78694.1 DUF86 domain-containing protein [Luteibaculum oceani]
MSKRDNDLLLEDMLEAAEKIEKYTVGYDFDKFSNEDKTIDAVIRNFEIIGEAANRVDPDFKLESPEIEWRKITGFRNRLIHEYFGVDIEILWQIIEDDIPDLIDYLKQILNKN